MFRAAVRVAAAFGLLASLAASHAAAPNDAAPNDGSPAAVAPHAAVTILDREPWSGVFGGSERTIRFDIQTADDAPKGRRRGWRANWTFATQGRTIARGELASHGDATRAEIPLRIPPVADGVIFPAELTLTVVAADASDSRISRAPAKQVKLLWIFPRDPFAGRKTWWAEQKLAVFDPDGRTRELLERAGLPFVTITRTAEIDASRQGTLIVGEGVSWDEHRGLTDRLVRRAAAGAPVLCLAPSAGRWPAFGANAVDEPAPSSVSWRRTAIVREFDKRLDDQAWPPDGAIAASGLRPACFRGEPAAEVCRDGWPWCEVRYAESRSALIVCGFGLASRWDAGPAPRFLLARILEHLATMNESPTHRKHEDER